MSNGPTPSGTQGSGHPMYSGNPPAPAAPVPTPVRLACVTLDALEEDAYAATKLNLIERVKGHRSPQDDDSLFDPFTSLLVPYWDDDLHGRAAALYLDKIDPLVDLFDEDLDAKTEPRVHRGSPLFNVGLCFYLQGNHAKAVQYMVSAGEANQGSGRGTVAQLVVQNHLARQVLLDPYTAWLGAECGGAYRLITGRPLTAAELNDIFLYASAKLVNGLVLVSTFPRLSGSMEGPDNDGAKVHRLRALADAVLVIESALAHQQAPGLDTLSTRIERMMSSGCRDCAREWTKAGNRSFNAGLITGQASDVNQILQREWAKLTAAGTPSQRIGIACRLALTLRNSIMHVVEDQLDVFQNRQTLLAYFGLALACLRMGIAGRDSDWAPLGI